MSLDEQPSSITEIQDKLVERVREVEGGGKGEYYRSNFV